MGKLKLPDLDLIRGEKSKRSLKEFIKSYWHVLEPQDFVDGWVIDAYCEHLTHIREIKNLLINVPPGASKSLVFSVFFFCWHWLHEPSSRFLYSSYSLGLSERDSMKCRRLIAHPSYQKCFKDIFSITEAEDTKRLFSNNQTGYRQAISIGSTTTGLKCNFAIMDDPLNASDADSDIKKADCCRWFTDSYFNRLNDFGKDCRIVLMQRLAHDDLSAYILEHYKETFIHLVIPYEYKKTNYVSVSGWKDPRAEEGEKLWPERYPESFIKDERRKQVKFESQYNQSPINSKDALFHPDTFRYYDELADGYKLDARRIPRTETYRIMTCDLAVSMASRADYTVIVVADVTRSGELIIVHILRDKMPGTKLVPTIKEVFNVFRPAYVLVEDVAMQKVILDQARAEGLPIRGIRPQGDKESRSLPLQVRFSSGQVWFPKDKGWMAAVEKELLEFPQGAHDDIVDAMSYLAIDASKRFHKPVETVQVQEKSEQELYKAAMLEGLLL